MTKRKIFPLISFSLMQKNKYLYFIVADIVIGVGAWLFGYVLGNSISSPKELLSQKSISHLFYYLWAMYFIVFLTYYGAEKRYLKAQKKMETDVAEEPA